MKYRWPLMVVGLLTACAVPLGGYAFVPAILVPVLIATALLAPSGLFVLLPFTSITWVNLIHGDGALSFTLNDLAICLIYASAGVRATLRLVKSRRGRTGLSNPRMLLPVLTLVCLIIGAVGGAAYFGLPGIERSLAVFGKQWAIYACLPLAAGALLKQEHYRAVLTAFIGAALALAFTTFFDLPQAYLEALGMWERAFGERRGGLLYNPNVTATFLMLAILVLTADREYTPRSQSARIVTVCILAAGLISTGTRGVIAITTFLVVVWNWKRILTKPFVYGTFMISVIGALIFLFYTPSGLTLLSRFAVIGGPDDTSGGARVAIQLQGLDIISQAPLGIGPGNLGEGRFGLSLPLTTTDNQFIDSFVALGWLGGTVFLLTVALPLLSRRNPRKSTASYILAALGMAGFIYTPLFFPAIATIYWLITGLVLLTLGTTGAKPAPYVSSLSSTV